MALSLSSVWRLVLMSSLSSAWRTAVRIQDNIVHTYPKLPAFPFGEENLPLLIGRNISIEDYNTFLDRNESTKLKFHWINGNVYIVATPLPVHEAVVSMLLTYFRIPNGVLFDPPIEVLGAPFHYDPSDNTYTKRVAADVTVRPNRAHLTNPIVGSHPGPPPCDVEKNPHGRVFCEIAYTEGLAPLHDKCKNWLLEGCVRYVLGIKIYEKRKGSNDRAMTARLYSRMAAPATGPAAIAVQGMPGIFFQEWHFGTVQLNNNNPTGCVALNNNAYQVTIPVSEIFWDPPIGAPIGGYVATVPNIATIIAPNVVIDLYRIQQEILRNSP